MSNERERDARVEAAALEIYRRTGLDMTMELCRELAAPVLAAADAVGGSPTAPNLACKSVQARLATQWGYVRAADAVGGEAVAGSARGFAEWIKSQPADREPTTLDEALSEYLRTNPAPAAPAVPEGYALVPVEPTRAMLIAAAATDVGPDSDGVHRLEPWLTALWAAMLSAAPQAAAPADFLPLLLRDLCRELGIGIHEACAALRDAGIGGASQGAAVTPAMARTLRDRFPAPQQESATPEYFGDGPLVEGWQLSISNGHSGYGVYAHMTDYPEEGAVFLLAAPQAAAPAGKEGEPHERN